MVNKDIISIAIADEHTIFRNGLINIIRSWQNCNIVLEANNRFDLIENLRKSNNIPDICIIDLGIPVNYEVIKEIKQEWPILKILIFSVINTEFSIVKMINIGVNGFLSMDCSPDEMLAALVSLHTRGYYYSSIFSENFFIKAKKSALLRITYREMEFLTLCCSDLGYKSIAGKMGISVRTIESYRNSLYEKLNVKSRMGLMIYALKTGIFPTDKLQQLTISY